MVFDDLSDAYMKVITPLDINILNRSLSCSEYWCICIFIFIYELAFLNVIVYMRAIQVVMMLSAGYFRIRSALPGPVWTYPVSYIAFHTYSIQASLLVIALCCILHMSSCVSLLTLWLTHLLLLNQFNTKTLTIRHIRTFLFPL
jgi:hypothetical protein